MNRFTLLAAGMALSGIAHAAEPNPSGFELTLVDLQGQKKVLGTLPGSVVAPRVSPDGTRVAFEMTEDTPPPPVTRPFVAQLDKLDQKRGIQPTLLLTRNVSPVWSHDSDSIAFLSPAMAPTPFSGSARMARYSRSTWWTGVPQTVCTRVGCWPSSP